MSRAPAVTLRMVSLVRLLIAGFVGLVLIYLIIPSLVVVPLSFSAQEYLSFPPQGFSTKWYQRLAANPAWLDATLNSLLIGIPTALLSMVLGTLAALAIVRGSFARATLLSALLVAPMMLPHVILAIGLYPVMLEIGLLRSHVAAILGHTVIGMPLVFITVTASLRSYSGALERAAMTLGANLWQTFWKVTFPMIRPGIIIGGILAFASSFDELMLSLFLTGATTRTLPRLMWEQMADFLTPVIAAAASLVFVFSLVMLGLTALLQRRSRGRIGGGAHG
jgi:ABC-type spermidine/putrescine transport system permease subunit II